MDVERMTSGNLGYREHAPAPALQGLVDCYWSFSGGSGAASRVLPDGCADLLLDRTTGALRFVGTMTRALVLAGRRGQDLIAVRFRPGGARALLGVAMGACVDIAAPWSERSALELHERAGDAAPEEGCRVFEALLLARLAAVSSKDRRQADLAGQCFGYPNTPVGALAERLGVSRQHLGREVYEATGVRPKTLARIGRLQRATSMIASGRRADAVTALTAGYCDQSHMANEFRALTGVTPGSYAREIASSRARRALP